MDTFETYYTENLIDEGIIGDIGDKMKGAIDATTSAAGDVVSNVSDKAEEVKASLETITQTITSIPQALMEMGSWTVTAAQVGIGGAIASQGLGFALTMIANKLDKDRLEVQKQKAGNMEILKNNEFQKMLASAEKLSDQEMMAKLDEISDKWAKLYKVPEPQKFVAAIRKIGEGLRSKLGTAFGVLVAVMAFKMGTPFPTF